MNEYGRYQWIIDRRTIRYSDRVIDSLIKLFYVLFAATFDLSMNTNKWVIIFWWKIITRYSIIIYYQFTLLIILSPRYREKYRKGRKIRCDFDRWSRKLRYGSNAIHSLFPKEERTLDGRFIHAMKFQFCRPREKGQRSGFYLIRQSGTRGPHCLGLPTLHKDKNYLHERDRKVC